MKLFATPVHNEYSKDITPYQADYSDEEDGPQSGGVQGDDEGFGTFGLHGPFSFGHIDRELYLSCEEMNDAVRHERETDVVEMWLRTKLFAGWCTAKEALQHSSWVDTNGELALLCAPEKLHDCLTQLAAHHGVSASLEIQATVELAKERSRSPGSVNVTQFLQAVDGCEAHRSATPWESQEIRWLRGLICTEHTAVHQAVFAMHEQGCFGHDEEHGAIISEPIVWSVFADAGIPVPQGYQQALCLRYSAFRGRASFKLFRAEAFLQALKCPVTLTDFWLCRAAIAGVTHAAMRGLLADLQETPFPAKPLAGDVLVNPTAHGRDTRLKLSGQMDDLNLACKRADSKSSGHIALTDFQAIVSEQYGTTIPAFWLDILCAVYNHTAQRCQFAYPDFLEDLDASEIPRTSLPDFSTLPPEPDACCSLIRTLRAKWVNRQRPCLGDASFATPAQLQGLLSASLGLRVDGPLLDVLTWQLAMPCMLGVRRSYCADSPPDTGLALATWVRQPRPVLLPARMLEGYFRNPGEGVAPAGC